MNQLILMKQTLYRLKREYGYLGALYRTTIGETDLSTGEKSTTRVRYGIDQMVVLPFKFDSAGFYGNALLKAGRSFSYGGFQDQDLKFVIIDGVDLPDDFQILPEDYLVYEHNKYEIVKIQKLEQDVGYMLTANWLRGSVPQEIHEVVVYQKLRFTQGVLNGS